MHNDEANKKLIGPVLNEQLLPEHRPDKPEEACGVFAVMAAQQPVANLAYFGLYALQHRGQESAGIAVFDEDEQVRLHKDMGLVSQVFDQDVLQRCPATWPSATTATPPPAAAGCATPSPCCSTPGSARWPWPTTAIW
jgi:amidophosphoribosyltransferase